MRNSLVIANDPFCKDTVISMAKDNTHWFQRACINLDKKKTREQIPHTDKNSSLILKAHLDVWSVRRTCVLRVDCASKEENSWSGIGFTANLPNGNLIT